MTQVHIFSLYALLFSAVASAQLFDLCDVYNGTLHQDFEAENVIRDLENTTLETCCSVCFDDPDCWSYAFNMATSSCRLIDGLLDLNRLTSDSDYVSGSLNNLTLPIVEQPAPAPEGPTLPEWASGDIGCDGPTLVGGRTSRGDGVTIEGHDSDGVLYFFETAEDVGYMFDTCLPASAFNTDINLFGPGASRTDTLEEAVDPSRQVTDPLQYYIEYVDATGYVSITDTCGKATGIVPAGSYWVLLNGREPRETDFGRYEGDYRIQLSCGSGDPADNPNLGLIPGAAANNESSASQLTQSGLTALLMAGVLGLTR